MEYPRIIKEVMCGTNKYRVVAVDKSMLALECNSVDAMGCEGWHRFADMVGKDGNASITIRQSIMFELLMG